MNAKTRTVLIFLCSAIAMAFVAPQANAAGKNDKEKARLKARFEQRYPDVQRAKIDGKIGETTSGFLEAVKDPNDASIKQLLFDENADRKALYALIAEDEGTTPDVVAQRAANRNFDKARPGEYLKSNGAWKRK